MVLLLKMSKIENNLNSYKNEKFVIYGKEVDVYSTPYTQHHTYTRTGTAQKNSDKNMSTENNSIGLKSAELLRQNKQQ